MMDELKPCPKCGGKGMEKVGNGYPTYIFGMPTGISLGHVVICEKCGYHTQAYDEPLGAFDDWNRRADNDRQ
jgi:hypothetical protein